MPLESGPVLMRPRYSASASCAVRSGVQCYNTRHKYVFDAQILKPGDNVLTLSLPSEAMAAAPRNPKMPGLLYVQYDALRLEVA
jgi:rhamnogalacturonan endolyase